MKKLLKQEPKLLERVNVVSCGGRKWIKINADGATVLETMSGKLYLTSHTGTSLPLSPISHTLFLDLVDQKIEDHQKNMFDSEVF